MIKNIYFIGDIMRGDNINYHKQDGIVKLLYNIFKTQIENACDCNVEILKVNNDIISRKKILELCGKKDLDYNFWVELYSGKYTELVVDYFKECFHDSLIIFQEAGSLRNIVDAANIPYIDIFISSIRFLEDLHFAFRTNISGIREKLKYYRLPEEVIYYNAAKIRTLYNRSYEDDEYIKNSLLILGQTEIDLSLIKDGKIASLYDFKDTLMSLANRYNHIYYKPHPYCNPNSKNERYIRSLSGIELISDNFYKMISSENIEAVAALSSGCLKEAPYFGKKVHTLLHPYINYYKGEGDISKDDFIICKSEYFSPTFWADILSPLVKTKKCEYFNFESQKDCLRNIIGTNWGYQFQNIELNKLNKEINILDRLLYRKTMAFKEFRRLLSLFVPDKRLRRRIRGDE